MPKKAGPGDIVLVKTETEEIKGTLLPSFEKDVFLLKLESGYNMGIKKDEVKEMKVLKKAAVEAIPESKIKAQAAKPGISIIATGGTISSRLDYTTGGVKPLTKPEQIFFLAPKLFDIVKINSIEQPFMIASEDMSAEHWQKIAKTAAELLNKKENKGIIITHGTDTLHYTAAALSFMLRNLNKPVVLTYAQRSTDRGSTDAALNLTCAASAALSNIAEVMLVGHASTSDDFCHALRGTKCRKMHTSRRDTFKPINSGPLAKIDENGKLELLEKNFNKRDENKKVIADTAFEEKVALVKYFPGAKPEQLKFFIKQGYRGIVIEATGLGHVATESKHSWLPAIKKAVSSGMTICFAPQTIYGRLDPYVYANGRKLLEAGVIFLEDMLPETAYVKLGWVLGKTKKPDEIKQIMLQNIAGEFNRSLSISTFPAD